MDGDAPRYHTLLGSTERTSRQFGILGECVDDRGRIAAVDLDHMSCIALFGEPGAGKSYCMGTIIEMAATAIPRLNLLPRPLTTIIFHYSSTQVYQPEFCSSILPNDNAAQVAALKALYGADPARVRDCLLLAPKAMVATRAAEFPGIPCAALTFASRELQAGHWKVLTGAVGEDDSLYFQALTQILRRHRDGTTPDRLLADIAASALSPADQDKARIRIGLAAEFIDEARELKAHVVPGRMIIVDLRDEYLQKREALALLITLLQLFADAVDADGEPFPKLVVFDEAHKYLRDPALVEALTETIREMRHKSTSIMIASQDPPSVPLPIIELSTMVVLLKMTSPLWLEHVQRVKAAFLDLTPHQLAALGQGEAFVWAKNASDPAYTLAPQKFKIRPRATKHGGDTKVAVKAGGAVTSAAPG